MKKNIMLAFGLTWLCAGGAMAQLANPGFEADGGSLSGWSSFDNASVQADISHNNSGHAAKFYGNWAFPYNAAGCFQDFPASAGQTWTASAWFLNSSTDPITNTQNFGAINIEWHRADGSTISYLTQRAVDGASPTDQWQQFTISGEAPAGTVVARVVPIFLQPNYEGGSVFVDDVAFSAAAAPCAADFNHDGIVDFNDYLDFVDAFSTCQ